jgi:predicted phage-related endonuclease
MSKGKLTPDTMMSASRLPGLLGLSKYSTPNDELLLSVRALDGEKPPPLESEAAEWGNLLEMEILQESIKRLGLVLCELTHTKPLFHVEWPLCTSLDGTADGNGLVVTTDPDKGIFVVGQDQIVLEGWGVLEAKLTSQDAEDTPPLWRGPVQLQGQMAVLNAKWGAVCTLYRGTKLRIFLFERHQQTINAIEHAVKDFQRRLDIYKTTGELDHYPAFDSADANKLFPMASDSEVQLSPNAEELCQKILGAKEQIKELETQVGFYETSLKESMTTHSKGLAGKYRISWPMRHYKAQPERVVAATEARAIRQSTLTIKEIK